MTEADAGIAQVSAKNTTLLARIIHWTRGGIAGRCGWRGAAREGVADTARLEMAVILNEPPRRPLFAGSERWLPARGALPTHAAWEGVAPKARATATKVAAMGNAAGSWKVKRRTL